MIMNRDRSYIAKILSKFDPGPGISEDTNRGINPKADRLYITIIFHKICSGPAVREDTNRGDEG